MDELKDILREYVKRNQLLESSNELLREKLLEQEKLVSGGSEFSRCPYEFNNKNDRFSSAKFTSMI